MTTRSMLFTTIAAGLLTLSACSGGGSDDSGPCSALKIAGGEGCGSPPNALVIVVLEGGYCTGTFITSRHVLTAAHCVDDQTVVSVQGPTFSAAVQSGVVHPLYNPSVPSSEYDVAVLTIPVSAPVTAVPLLRSVAVQADDQVVAYGYGLDQDGNTAYERYADGEDTLKATYLDVPSVSNFSVNTISDGSGDTCAGDSGGPILLQNSAGAYGIVATTRFGPARCVEYQPNESDNTNLQNPAVYSFVKSAAPGLSTN